MENNLKQFENIISSLKNCYDTFESVYDLAELHLKANKRLGFFDRKLLEYIKVAATEYYLDLNNFFEDMELSKAQPTFEQIEKAAKFSQLVNAASEKVEFCYCAFDNNKFSSQEKIINGIKEFADKELELLEDSSPRKLRQLKLLEYLQDESVEQISQFVVL